MQRILHFLEAECACGKKIYPPLEERFAAFQATPYDALRVVIVGQDPYHGEGQAHGLAFSVPEGVKIPPSLRNIYQELKNDLDIPPPAHGCLLSWAKQGVLLLNETLTVEEGQPHSHAKMGWEHFTDNVLLACMASSKPLIFVLWGKTAQEKVKKLIAKHGCKICKTHHHFLNAAHPSPFSARRGFFGCRHFSTINKLLEQEGSPVIEWRVD